MLFLKGKKKIKFLKEIYLILSSFIHSTGFFEALYSSEMAGFVAMIVYYLVLLQTFNIFAAKDEEWISATATYSKETDGSIVTGTVFLLFVKLHSCLNMVLFWV